MAGAGALLVDLLISAAIALLLISVTFSYRQTIFAYPSGGGSYIVASENLGRIPWPQTSLYRPNWGLWGVFQGARAHVGVDLRGGVVD